MHILIIKEQLNTDFYNVQVFKYYKWCIYTLWYIFNISLKDRKFIVKIFLDVICMAAENYFSDLIGDLSFM